MAEETQAAVAPPVDLPPSEQPPAPKPDLPAVAEKEAPPPPSVADVSTSETDSSVKLEKGESPADPEPAVPKSEAPAPQDEEQEKKREEQPAADALSAEHEKQEITEKAELQQPQVAVVESRSLAAMMEKEESGPVAEVTEKAAVTTASGTGDEDPTVSDEKKLPQNLVSFKEESNKIADLSYFERNALQELKQLVQKALDAHEFISTKEKGPATEASASESNVGAEIDPLQQPKADKNATMEKATVSIWGIPLLEDDRSDVILLKFLRARDFRVNDAFTMIKNTIQWRKEFGIDVLVEEDLGDDLEKVVFMHGHDREGHPVCFNVYGEFQNKELYQKTFSDEEKRMKFLRWRIQFLERGIRKLDFTPGGISTIFQVNDLKNSPGPGKRELRLATKQALQLLQDNYPEFVAKQVFINVPWWYLAFYTMISPFMTQRTKSKFVFARPSRSADTLFKYISPEQVPIQYGGLSVDNCDCNPEFSVDDPATEIIVKPGTKQTVEIAIYEKCVIVWEIRVVGWEVIYGAEFAPNSRESYTVIIQKPTKMSPKDEPVSYHSFKVGELGKILLTVDNPTSKKKKLLYRFKVRPFSD